MIRRPPTQKQIAERLGLSPATVSLALRDSPMISADTRSLVQTAIKESGYVHNFAAASLRTGRSRIVGVSFHNIAHQFFAEMLIAIEDNLGAAGITVFINNHGEDPSSLARFVDSLVSHGAEALLVSPPPHVTGQVLSPLRGRGMPVIYISRYLKDDDDADRVINADATASGTAAGRLIGLGHRRIVLVGGQPGTTVAEERVAGFKAAIEAAGITWSDDLWLQCRPRLAEGAKEMLGLVNDGDRPTGFVCFNDLVAFGTMNALRTRGLEPGVDVGVVGIGGTDEAMAFHPSLTTVLDNPAKIGQIAAETLLTRLAEPDTPPRHITLAPKLVVRASCGGPVAG
ncbi:MAG: LacI family DNA-binding transcriptional regulator [Aestuariivirgaceae bacterium]